MWECVQMKQPAIIDLLLQFGGSLEMTGAQIASVMSQLVAENDLAVLHNYIKCVRACGRALMRTRWRRTPALPGFGEREQITPTSPVVDQRRAGAKAEEADYLGSTPLHVAAALGNLDAVRLLVEEGNATVDVRDVFGRTPLDCAAFAAERPDFADAGAQEVVNYLTPLTEAAQKVRSHSSSRRERTARPRVPVCVPDAACNSLRAPLPQGWIKSHQSRGAPPNVMALLGHGDIDRVDTTGKKQASRQPSAAASEGPGGGLDAVKPHGAQGAPELETSPRGTGEAKAKQQAPAPAARDGEDDEDAKLVLATREASIANVPPLEFARRMAAPANQQDQADGQGILQLSARGSVGSMRVPTPPSGPPGNVRALTTSAQHDSVVTPGRPPRSLHPSAPPQGAADASRSGSQADRRAALLEGGAAPLDLEQAAAVVGARDLTEEEQRTMEQDVEAAAEVLATQRGAPGGTE